MKLSIWTRWKMSKLDFNKQALNHNQSFFSSNTFVLPESVSHTHTHAYGSRMKQQVVLGNIQKQNQKSNSSLANEVFPWLHSVALPSQEGGRPQGDHHLSRPGLVESFG